MKDQSGIHQDRRIADTDELGYRFLPDGQKAHVRDLQVIMSHARGPDHMKLSAKDPGLDVRLTGVEPARVPKDILR